MLEGPPRKKKKGQTLVFLIAMALISTVAWLTYRYAGTLKQRFFDAPELTLVRNRMEHYNTLVHEKKSPSKTLYPFLEEARGLLEKLEVKHPADPVVPYYHGLFSLHEFLLRVPLNSENLLELTGRGYLPGGRSGYSERSIETLARDISIQMRKSLALEPDFPEKNTAILGILLGDLFGQGRTDPFLLQYAGQLKQERLAPVFRPAGSWILLTLSTILGDVPAVEVLLNPPVDPDQTIGSSHLVLTDVEKKLLLAETHFYGKNYLQALRLVREIKATEGVSTKWMVEALRLEGEIFVIQRGPLVGLYFFQQALAESGGKDLFLVSRIQSIRSELQQ